MQIIFKQDCELNFNITSRFFKNKLFIFSIFILAYKLQKSDTYVIGYVYLQYIVVFVNSYEK